MLKSEARFLNQVSFSRPTVRNNNLSLHRGDLQKTPSGFLHCIFQNKSYFICRLNRSSCKSARDGVALCQTIPGATAMQMSAYVGLRAKGVAGAGASFIGFGLPAFLFMMILSALYARTHTLPAVVSVFNGLQAIIVAVVANAALSFGKTSIKNWKMLSMR